MRVGDTVCHLLTTHCVTYSRLSIARTLDVPTGDCSMQQSATREPASAEEQRRADKRLPHKLRFTKVYNRGWKTLGHIASNPMAMRVYAFLAEHADHHNAVVCSIQLMAKQLGVNGRTIIRATTWLKENHHLVVGKIATANVYILNCDDLWKTYEDQKRYCGVSARALIDKSENKAMKRRIEEMVEAQGDLFVGSSTPEEEAAA